MSSDGFGDGRIQSEIEWAHEYDGYARLARSPEALWRLLEPADREFRSTGEIPDWCGVDLLRGWAFYLVRADRHAGGGTLGRDWMAVLEALRHHPDIDQAERPPDRHPEEGP